MLYVIGVELIVEPAVFALISIYRFGLVPLLFMGLPVSVIGWDLTEGSMVPWYSCGIADNNAVIKILAGLTSLILIGWLPTEKALFAIAHHAFLVLIFFSSKLERTKTKKARHFVQGFFCCRGGRI
jgi:hypothetical protein